MSQPRIPTAHTPADLPPMPIDLAWIQEGTPTACGAVLTQSQDKLLSSGFWSCTAGKFQWVFAWDEFVCILEGEVTIPISRAEALLLEQVDGKRSISDILSQALFAKLEPKKRMDFARDACLRMWRSGHLLFGRSGV